MKKSFKRAGKDKIPAFHKAFIKANKKKKEKKDMTKKERKIIVDWFNSTSYELYHCYGKHSDKKEEAFNYCKELFNFYGGLRFRIISFNKDNFSAGFYFYDSMGEHFCYIRKDRINIFKPRFKEDENDEDLKNMPLFSYVNYKLERGLF